MRLRRLLGFALLVILVLAPAATFAQFNQAPLISTSLGGIISGTNVYAKNISASSLTVGSCTGCVGGSALASLTDVNVSDKVSGSVLVYSGVTTSWTALPIQQVMSTTTMVINFPDAIRCTVGSNNRILYLSNGPASDGNYYYMLPADGATFAGLGFSSSGAYVSGSDWGLTFSDCHISVPSLYAAGRAFNFIGTGATGNYTTFSGNSNNGTLAAGTTNYAPVVGNFTMQTTDSSTYTRTLISRTGTVQSLVYKASANNSSGKTNTITVYKNGSSTSLTCSVTAATTCNDFLHSFAVAAGDEIGIQIVTGSATNTAVKHSWSVEVSY